MDIFLESQKYYNFPLIDFQFTTQDHLIYIKYTSDKYFKYSTELLDSLCKNSLSDNPRYLFQLSFSYFIKILYNCGNTPCLNNLDLLIFCSFLLGMKVSENQHKCLTITKIKNMYPERFAKYNNEEINFGEIICIKLLQYNINILTPYECLLYILKRNNNLPLLNNANNILEKFFFDKKFLLTTPMQLAKDSIKQIKQQIIIKKPIIMTKKNLSFGKSKKTLHSSKGNESISTGASSILSNTNINLKKHNIKKPNFVGHKLILSNNIRFKNFSRDKFHNSKSNSKDFFYCKHYEVNNSNNVNKSLNASQGKLNTINITNKLEKCRFNSSVGLNNNKNFISIDNNDNNEKAIYKKPIKKISIEGYENNNIINDLCYNGVKNKNKLNNKTAKNKINQLSLINSNKHKDSLCLSTNFNLINSPDFQKPTIIKDSNKCVNLVKKLKLNINKNEKQKKIISIWKCEQKNSLYFNYDKISDLCSKLNFDLVNHISGEVVENKE